MSADDMVLVKASTGTGKVFALWKGGANEYGKAVLLTVSNSSDTLTAGTVTNFRGTNETKNIRAVYNEEDDNIMISFSDGEDSNKPTLQRFKLNTAGTAIEADGGETQFDSNTSIHMDHRVYYSKGAKSTYVVWRNSSAAFQARRITNSTGTPSLGTTTTPWSGLTINQYTMGQGILILFQDAFSLVLIRLMLEV